MHTVISIASICAARSVKVMQGDEEWEDERKRGVASTDTDHLKSMSSESQPLLARESLVAKLPTTIPNLVYHAFSQGLELLGEVPGSENSLND